MRPVTPLARRARPEPRRPTALVRAPDVSYLVPVPVLSRLQKLSSSSLQRVAWGVALAGVVGAMTLHGLSIGLLTVAGVMLLATVVLLWSSVQSLTGEAEMSLDEALGLAAPSAEEERKRAVLRALKDLEYERGVGKISEEDYAELVARYRADAKALLRALEAQDEDARARAERLVARRLRKAGLEGSVTQPEAEPEPSADRAGTTPEGDPEPTDAAADSQPAVAVARDAKPSPASTPARGPRRRCSECEARNDLDARFCKKCGAPLAEKDERLCLACPAVYAETEESCPECGVSFDAA